MRRRHDHHLHPRFAYGANLGWVDWRGDTANGAVVGEYVCSGYLYAANVGWISLGSASPANGIGSGESLCLSEARGALPYRSSH